MRKDEFLKRLEYLLQDVPDQEKSEAIQYYRDYIEEAGPENEEKAVEEFGSPERVAAIIRADMMGNLEEGGSFTETGYVDERFRDPNFQVAKRFDLPEEKQTAYRAPETENPDPGYNHVKSERWTSKPLKWALWAILILLASPILLAGAGVVCALLLGGAGLLASGILTVISLAIAAFILAVVAAAFGVVFLAGAQLEGLMLIGLAFAAFGCGLLALVLTVVLVGSIIPFIWNCLVKLVAGIAGLGRGKKHE